MKNKKGIIILVGILIIGVIFFLTKGLKNNDSSEIKDEDIETNENIAEESENQENQTSSEEEEDDIPEDLQVGNKMRDFVVQNKKGEQVRLKNLDGEEVSIRDYEGKIVFINFWATWCTFCDLEMPDLQKIQDENDDVVVLAVNVAEDKKAVEKYMKKGGYEFDQVILDADSLLAQDFYVAGFPSTYFVDKDGTFLGMVPQMITYDQMNEILADIRSN